MRNHRMFTAATACFVLAIGMSACGGGSDEEGTASKEGPLVIDGHQLASKKLWKAAQQEGTVTLYTAMGEERETEMDDVFTKQTGIDVNIIRLPGGRLVQRVLTEHGAGKLGADVIRQTDYTLATSEKKDGVFQRYCPPGIKKVDKNLREEDCSFYASQTPIYAIGYNNAQISEEDAPTSWKGLLDPKWKGKVGLAQIGAGGSTWARDLFLREKYGVKYWKKLAAQDPFITDGAANVTQQMARGEIQLGAVLPGNQSVAADQGAPLSLVLPKDGIPSYAQWTGLVKSAKHPNAAKVYINWQMTMPGQSAVASKAGDYPVIPGAPGPDFNGKELPSREKVDLVLMELDPKYVSKRDSYMDQWYSIFGYTPQSDG